MTTRLHSLILLMTSAAAAPLIACGSSADSDETESPEGEFVTPRTFEQIPPPPEGYTRLVAPVIEDIPAGETIERCQYVRTPFEQNLDVLDVRGYQTIGGHHSVVFTSSLQEPVGTSRVCTDADNTSVGSYLGGPEGDTGDSVPLPEGTAFRVRQGQTVMLNTHFINTSSEAIDGYTVIDIKFAEVDESRIIATLFPIGGMNFEIPAQSESEFSTECVVPERLELVGASSHMHDWGTRQITEIQRANGEVIVLREDPTWTYEMQFNAPWTFWDIQQPLIIEPGDTVRTRCTWSNTTNEALTYPHEMCFGRNYILSSADQFPICLDGSFLKF